VKIFKTVVTNGAAILPIDTISYKEGLWLVPNWVPARRPECLMPARMVRIDRLSLRKLHAQLPWDYHLLDRVPDDVLIGSTDPEDGAFEIIERPQDVVREICLIDE
jgi:hypothetical protein